MIDVNIKQTVLRLKSEMSVPDICSLFNGVVSTATIYNWLCDSYEYRYLNSVYPENAQHREWNRYCNLKGDYNAFPSRNKIILSHQSHFYDVERELFKKPDIRKKLADNRYKYIGKTFKSLTDMEILRGFKISGIHAGYSHFSPLWLKAFIEDYSPQAVYDPCGGWGHRLVGAATSNCNYIYNDLWDRSYNGARSIIKMFNIKNIVCFNEDASKFRPPGLYDCVFTCPPYYNIEIYGNNIFNSEESYFKWWSDVVDCSYTPTVKVFAFIINDKYINDLISICIAKFNKTPQVKRVGSKQSHFNRSNNSVRGENLVTFKLS